VTVTETDRNRGWAESKIKAITGGDEISARFMHGDFFEYKPTYKLMIAGNHRPRLGSFGEAMRRRLHLIPFDVTIPLEAREADLAEALRAERGGILNWMIEGCADWLKNGLCPPDRVRLASQEYFAEEDVVGQWLDERCVLSGESQASAHELYQDWRDYAEAAGHDPGSKRSFGEDMRARGFTPYRSSNLRGWRGISLARAAAAR
jgi:putative DNA primase/helicase